MNRIIIIAVVFLLINSCSDESTMFDPTYFGDGFKGITFTHEEDPTPLKADPTDWHYSISYNQHKGQNTPGISVDIKGIDGFMFAPAYPNPSRFDSGFSQMFSIPNDMVVNMYILNNNYEIVAVLFNAELYAGTHVYWFENKNLKAPGVYRVIMEASGFYSKGDVWIK